MKRLKATSQPSCLTSKRLISPCHSNYPLNSALLIKCTIMKLAQQNALSATIVDEKGAVSPFALIIHSDHAITKEETNLKAILDKPSDNKPAEQTKTKGKSLWQRLFH